MAAATGVAEALGNAFNPTVGTGPVDKVLPLIVAVAYVALVVLTIFGIVPHTRQAEAGMGVVSALFGFYVRHVGSANYPDAAK